MAKTQKNCLLVRKDAQKVRQNWSRQRESTEIRSGHVIGHEPRSRLRGSQRASYEAYAPRTRLVTEKIDSDNSHGHILAGTNKMALARPPRRFGLQELENMMARTRLHHRILLLAMIEERERRQQQNRRARRWWQKLWVERRPVLGQYRNLFEILDRHFEGDYFCCFILIEQNIDLKVAFYIVQSIIINSNIINSLSLLTHYMTMDPQK